MKMKKILLVTLGLYQKLLSPLMGPSCRFHPTCSEYAIEAIERFGVKKGVFLSIKRISKCHPWGGSGVDLVPRKN